MLRNQAYSLFLKTADGMGAGFSLNNKPKLAENTTCWHHASSYHPSRGGGHRQN